MLLAVSGDGLHPVELEGDSGLWRRQRHPRQVRHLQQARLLPHVPFDPLIVREKLGLYSHVYSQRVDMSRDEAGRAGTMNSDNVREQSKLQGSRRPDSHLENR